MSRFLMRMAAAALVAGMFGAGSADAAWPWSRTKSAEPVDGYDPEHPGFGVRLNNAYDPCWPERYTAVSRQIVLQPFAQQVLNGHVINQTIWNYHFEPNSDRLTAAGVEKLDSLVRVRPGPDTKIFIQTARDLPATPDTVDKLLASRNELDRKRANMVARFLAASPRPMPYEIYVHDPAEAGINSTAAGNAFRSQLQGYRGGISGGTVGASGSGGGSAPGASSGGSSSGGGGSR